VTVPCAHLTFDSFNYRINFSYVKAKPLFARNLFDQYNTLELTKQVIIWVRLPPLQLCLAPHFERPWLLPIRQFYKSKSCHLYVNSINHLYKGQPEARDSAASSLPMSFKVFIKWPYKKKNIVCEWVGFPSSPIDPPSSPAASHSSNNLAVWLEALLPPPASNLGTLSANPSL